MTRAALITGCAGGIGLPMCAAFRSAGYLVIGTDLQEPADSSALDVFVRADLAELGTVEGAAESFAQQVRETASGEGLSVLVNNAAVQLLGQTEALDLARFRQTLDINVSAPFALARAFLADLRANRGTVINIASVHARATKPQFVAYATSKAAIDGLTRALAVDLGPDVRVVALAPAAVDTAMLRAGFEGNRQGLAALENVHPAGRIAQPGEIGQIAVFLASDDARFMTGTTVYADGGVLSRLHDPA